MGNVYSYLLCIERSGLDYDPDEDWAIESYEKDYVPENCHYAEITCEDEEEQEERAL